MHPTGVHGHIWSNAVEKRARAYYLKWLHWHSFGYATFGLAVSVWAVSVWAVSVTGLFGLGRFGFDTFRSDCEILHVHFLMQTAKTEKSCSGKD